MFVEVIRLHMDQLANNSTGWLAGLRDPLVGRALTLLHARPAHAWTLEELAAQAAASRSTLADRFSQFGGLSANSVFDPMADADCSQTPGMIPVSKLPPSLMKSATNPKLHSAERSKNLSAARRANGDQAFPE